MKSHLKLKKLNTKGLGHHALIAVLVISGIAGFGAWRVYQSQAAISAQALCGTGYSLDSVKRVHTITGTYTTGPAELRVFRNGTKLCGVLMSTGSAYGVSKYMEIEAYASRNNVRKTDKGDFRYYAGPVKIDQVSLSSSAYFNAVMKYGGKTYATSKSY